MERHLNQALVKIHQNVSKKCLKTSIYTLDAKCECDLLESNKEIALQSLILQVLVWWGGGGGGGGWKFVPPSKQMFVQFCDFVEQ